MHATSRIINLYSDGRLDVVLETKFNLLEDVTVVGHGHGNLGQVHMGLEEINIAKIEINPCHAWGTGHNKQPDHAAGCAKSWRRDRWI